MFVNYLYALVEWVKTSGAMPYIVFRGDEVAVGSVWKFSDG